VESREVESSQHRISIRNDVGRFPIRDSDPNPILLHCDVRTLGSPKKKLTHRHFFRELVNGYGAVSVAREGHETSLSSYTADRSRTCLSRQITTYLAASRP